MKKGLKFFAIFVGSLIVLILIVSFFFVNNESTDYKSFYNYTDSKSLKETIRNEKRNAIVIITSPTCPGVPQFMPKIENQQELLKQKNIDVYYVVNMLNGDTNDSLLTDVIERYNIHYKPLIINPKQHPSGNLFNASRKYKTFLNELCDTCNDGSLGYPLYVYYKNGEYLDKTYYLNDKALASLN